MLDEDLANLYGVQTRRLVERVKRNRERFPFDFMFQLTKDEAAALRSQSVRSNPGRGGRRYAPYVFTEQGVAMLSSVLRSERAVAVNIAIVRAFVELRHAVEHHLHRYYGPHKRQPGEHFASGQTRAVLQQAIRHLIDTADATIDSWNPSP